MRAAFYVTLASLSLVAAAPAPAETTTTATSCTDKCTGYSFWMNSCAGYEPSGSAWPASCSEYCTSSSKQKAWNSCLSCMSASGGGSDNGSLNRICGQLRSLGKIANSTKTKSESAEEEEVSGSTNGTKKKKTSAAAAIGKTGLGPLGATVGALAVAALGAAFL